MYFDNIERERVVGGGWLDRKRWRRESMRYGEEWG